MRRLVIAPEGWSCTLGECPPGLFVYEGRTLGVKTEYRDTGSFIADSGEVFWGGTSNPEERLKLIVQPCAWKWEEVE